MDIRDRLKVRVYLLRLRLGAELDVWKEDVHRAVSPWMEYPGRMVMAMAVCGRRTMFFHEGNNRFRKLLVVVFSAVWILSFLGITFGYAEPPTDVFVMFTAFVFALVGATAGIEWSQIDPVTLTLDTGEGSSEEEADDESAERGRSDGGDRPDFSLGGGDGE